MSRTKPLAQLARGSHGQMTMSHIVTESHTEHVNAGARARRRNWALRLAILLSVLYVYSAFLPFEFRTEWWNVETIRLLLLRPPFHDRPEPTFGFYFSISNSIVNASAGVLLGWLAFLGWRRLSGWSLVGLVLAVAQTFATATAMEVVQVGVVGRVPTPTDICTITAGGGFGAVAAMMTGEFLWRAVGERLIAFLLARPAGLAVTLLVVFLLVRSLFPSRVSAVYGEIVRNAARANILPLHRPGLHLAVQLRFLGFAVDDTPYRSIRYWPELTPERYAYNLAGHFILYTAIATALAAARGGRWFGDLLFCGLMVPMLAATVEGLQVFLPNQRVDVNVVLVAMVAGFVGPHLWRIIRRSPSALAAVVLFGAAAFASTQLLSPGLKPTGPLTIWNFVPIHFMERSSHRLALLLNVFEGFAMLVPVGWAVSYWLLSKGVGNRAATVLAVLVAAAVAFGLEMLQVLVARVPSIDAVLFGAVGGAVGAWLAWRQQQLRRAYH